MPHALEAQRYVIEHGEPNGTLLDIGCGVHQTHAAAFMAAGFNVFTNDSNPNVKCDYDGVFTEAFIPGLFDVVWASHVLEHQPDVQAFLRKMIQKCKRDGLIAITVPPLKHQIVGGHLTLWNAGLVLYNLAFCGLDCQHAAVSTYGYNISVIVQKKTFEVADIPLEFDSADIGLLRDYLPRDLKFKKKPKGLTFDGNIRKLNWKS